MVSTSRVILIWQGLMLTLIVCVTGEAVAPEPIVVV